MSSPSPATAVRTLSAVETPASSGLYPPGLNRVAMPPNAQIPRLVFMSRPYRAVLAWFTLGVVSGAPSDRRGQRADTGGASRASDGAGTSGRAPERALGVHS